MPERDGAAVHIHLLLVGAEQLRRVARDRREGLVDLDALDVVDRLARLPERDRRRAGGRARQVGELVGDVALRDDRRERLDPAPPHPRLARDDDARGAVVDAGRVAGRRRPF